MSRWSQITYNSYRPKDSRVNLNRKNDSSVNWGYVMGEMVKDLMKQTANVAGAILTNKAKIDEKINTNVSDFLGSKEMSQATANLNQEQQEDFILKAQDDYVKGQELINKNSRDSKEWQEGQRLVRQANGAVQNAISQKAALNAKHQSEMGKNVDNLSPTSTPDQVNNTLAWQAGTFLQENNVYISYPSGNLMYDKKVEEKYILTQDEFNMFEERNYSTKNYIVGDTAESTAGPSFVDNPGFELNPYTISEQTNLNNQALSPGSNYVSIPVSDKDGNPMKDKFGNLRYKLIHNKPTSVFESETALMNQQNSANIASGKNSVTDRIDVLMHAASVNGWGTGYGKGVDGGKTVVGGSAYTDDDLKNNQYINDQKEKIRVELSEMETNDQQYRDYVAQATTQLEYTDENGDVVKTERVNLIDPILWNKGFQKYKLEGEELEIARKGWANMENGEPAPIPYTATLALNPTDPNDDITMEWSSEAQYNVWNRNYEIAKMAIIQKPNSLDKDDKQLVEDLLLDDLLHINKIATDQGKADKKSSEGNGMTQTNEDRMHWKNNLIKDWNTRLFKPDGNGGFKVPEPEEQIDWLKSNMTYAGQEIRYIKPTKGTKAVDIPYSPIPGTKGTPGVFQYNANPNAGVPTYYPKDHPLVVSGKKTVNDILSTKGEWINIPTKNGVIQWYDEKTHRFTVPSIVDWRNVSF
mgnify:FL=1